MEVACAVRALRLVILFSAAMAAGAAGASPRASKFNPAPAPAAVVVAGPARFTVLTPRVIRMEYQASQAWDDRATVNVIHRATAVPEFTVERGAAPGGGTFVTITTSSLHLRFVDDGGLAGGFTPDSLSVRVESMSPPVTWVPGTLARGNLHGTLRTLDRVGDAVDLTCLSACVGWEWGSVPRAQRVGARSAAPQRTNRGSGRVRHSFYRALLASGERGVLTRSPAPPHPPPPL